MSTVNAWHAMVADDADAWFAAEAAVADAVARSRRSAEQRVLLRAMAEAHTSAVWYRRGARGATPERRVGATEASGQYTATLAMLALLVHDHLDPRDFAVVYAPFARLIPPEELDEEPPPHEERAGEAAGAAVRAAAPPASPLRLAPSSRAPATSAWGLWPPARTGPPALRRGATPSSGTGREVGPYVGVRSAAAGRVR